MRDDRQRLLDIDEAIRQVEKYAARGRNAFQNDELIRVWIIYHLQIIGEASRSLSEDFRNKHPEISWAKAIGMRNILVHGYFGLDFEIVWAVIEHDLPILKQQIEAILRGQ